MKSLPLIVLIFFMALLSACGQASRAAPPVPTPTAANLADDSLPDATTEHDETGGHAGTPVDLSNVDYAYTLQTEVSSGFLYRGEDGTQNPVLRVPVGARVGLTVVNGDGVEHDLAIDVLGLHSGHVTEKGESSSIAFTAEETGTYAYYCTLPGHREAGMEGVLVVEANDGTPGR